MKFTTRSLRGLFVATLAAASATLTFAAAAQQPGPRVSVAARNSQLDLGEVADAGPVPSSQPVTLVLTLQPEPARVAALDQFLAAVVTPGDGNYHHWVTPLQYAASYGATPAQVAAAMVWAQQAGLAVESVSPAATRVTVSGSAARVQAAFATSLHLYQLNAKIYFAAASQPSLPVEAAALFSSVEGLDNLPAGTDFGTVAGYVDANQTGVFALGKVNQSSAFTALFRQAAAQGITTLVRGGTFADATSYALAGDPALASAADTPRPTWQSAPGLPADGLRAAPDLTVSGLSAFSDTLLTIAAGERLGNVAGVLYRLAPTEHLFDQAGNWAAATGLGVISLDKLATAFPRGVGSSYTSFAASNYGPTHGQATTFTSNVTSGTGGATPTGTVQFNTSTGLTLGTVALTAGSASLTVSTLDGGSTGVTAVYSGDATYASSSSPTAQIYVAAEPSTLSVAVSGTPVVGTTYSVTVTDTVTTGVPTLPVTLAVSGTSQSYTQTLVAAGGNSARTTFTVQAQAPGGTTLSVTCAGNNNYSCNNTSTIVVQIAKATPVLSISYTPNPVVSGQQVTLNATVSTSGTAPAPTGNVRFFDNGTQLNSGSLSGGATSTTGTVPTTATHSITATYDGDPNYNTVSTAAGMTTSGTIATTTTLTSSAASVSAGASITFTATISPASMAATSLTGTVQFFDGGTLLGSSGVSGNVATLSVTTLSSASSHSVTAVYSGDSAYTASTSNAVTLQTTTTAASTTTLTISPTAVTVGASVTLSAVVGPTTNGQAPTGTVQFLSAGNVLCAVPLTNGAGACTIKPTTAGNQTITASYLGDSKYAASTSAPGALVVTATASNLISTVTTLAATASTTTSGATVLTATVAASSAGATAAAGTVSFYDGALLLGTGTLTPTATGGTASLTVTVNNAVAHAFNAAYSGNALYAPSSSSAITGVGSSPAAITLSAGTSSAVSGTNVVLTAQVTGLTSSGASPTGTVSFYTTGTAARLLGTITLSATGTGAASAVLTSTGLPTGALTIDAIYSGDSNFATVTSNLVTLGVGDFSLSFSPANLTLARGATGTTATTVTFLGGLQGSVALACTPPSDTQITCAFSPATINGSGGSTLTVTTTSPKTAVLGTYPGSLRAGLAGGVAFASLFFVLLPGRRYRRLPALLILLLALTLLPNLGCGTGSAGTSITGGTPYGTSILTINAAATTGATTVRHTYYVQVTVQ